MHVQPGPVDLDHLRDARLLGGRAAGDDRRPTERPQEQIARQRGGVSRADRQRADALQLTEGDVGVADPRRRGREAR